MSWSEVQDRVQGCDIAILPIGAMEQHGNHLPVGTDNYQIETLCRLAAERVADTVGALVLPCLRYGSTTSTREFPGTVNVSPSVLIRYLLATIDALYRQGFRRFIIANGHGGNSYPKQVGSEVVRRYPDSEVFYTGTFGMGMWDLINADPENVMVGHACEIETSLMLAVREDLVDMDKVTEGEMFGEFLSKYDFVMNADYGVGILQNRWQTMEVGARGRPFRGTKAYGEQLIAEWVQRFAEMLEDMQARSRETTGRG
jgi:creatinine amidohydrolase